MDRRGVNLNWDAESTYLGVRVGPWRRQYEPGELPAIYMPTLDDCMRGSFCCVTGISPMDVPFIRPGQPGSNFWVQYRQLSKICGFAWDDRIPFHEPLSKRKYPWPFADDELWIAGVSQGSHAVVMKGQKLHYDCNNDPRRDNGPCGRKRRPNRVAWGIHLKPLVFGPA